MSRFTTKDVAELLDVSTARIRSFARAGFLSPKRDPRGRYRFSFQDLVLLRTAKELLDARVPARKVWQALRCLKDKLPNGRSLTAIRITAQGAQVVVRDKDTTWEPGSGQVSFDFSVSEMARRVAPIARNAAALGQGVSDMDSDAWFEIGIDLEAVAAIDEAKKAYHTAIELDSDNSDAHVNIGRLLQEEGRVDDAEAHYRKAITAAPDDPTAVFNLGTALEEMARLKEATDAYIRAIKVDPEFADAHYNLANLYEQIGDQPAAFRHLARYKALIEN